MPSTPSIRRPNRAGIMASSIDFLRRALYPLKGAEFAHADERAVLRAIYNNDCNGHDRHVEGLFAAASGFGPGARRTRPPARRCRTVRRSPADPRRRHWRAIPAMARSISPPRACSWRRTSRRTPIWQPRRRSTVGFSSVAAVGQLGLTAMAAGHVDEAIAAFRRAAEAPVARGSSLLQSCLRTGGQGRQGRGASMHSNKRSANGYRDAAAMGADPDLASLRGDARFEALKSRMASAPAG